MRRMMLAIRVFFATLFSAAVARQVGQIFAGAAVAVAGGRDVPRPEAKRRPTPRPPTRSDALTLLATLQREARFVDFVQEPLGSYTDAQIGAAARDVHRDCAAVLQRLFALKPILSEQEGGQVEVPTGFDAGRYRLTGNVTGEPPFRGQLVHHGWEATLCEMPSWSGTNTASRVVAPAEVELSE
jgi:hypothetical protein